LDLTTYGVSASSTDSTLYTNGHCYILSRTGGSATPRITKIQDTGPALVYVDQVDIADYGIGWGAEFYVHLVEFEGRLYVGCRNITGAAYEHAVSVAVDNFADIRLSNPKIVGLRENPGLVRVSDSDTTPQTLASKFPNGGLGGTWELLNPGGNESLRYHGLEEVLLLRRWVYSSNTTLSGVVASTFRMNNASPALTTAMSFHVDVTVDGSMSVYEVLKQVTVGTVLFMRRAGVASAAVAVFRVNGAPTDNTTWFELPVEFVRAGVTAWPTSGTFSVEFVHIDVLHMSTGGEIAALTEKVAPVSADHILIEDSADSNNKKRVQVGNLPSGGGSSESAITDTLTNDVNDYAPTGWDSATVVLLSTDGAPYDITGAVAPTGSGSIRKSVFNVHATQNIVLIDDSGSSSAGNRFALLGDITILPGGSLELVYDTTNSVWRML
jgi:hypothetical protein